MGVRKHGVGDVEPHDRGNHGAGRVLAHGRHEQAPAVVAPQLFQGRQGRPRRALVAFKKEEDYRLVARKVDEVIGKKARTTLRANQPVRADQVEKVPLIKSGQMVTIIAENGVLKISVAGKAHSSGAEGDIIRVQNLTSLKEIPAKVIDASTVQVAF